MNTLSSTPVYVTCPFWSKVFQQFHIQQLCSVLLAALVYFFLFKKIFQANFWQHFNYAIIPTCFELFPPNLDTITMTTSHLCHMTLRGQKVTQGSQGSKVWFYYKTFQLQQSGWNFGTWIIFSLCTKVKPKIKFKGH